MTRWAVGIALALAWGVLVGVSAPERRLRHGLAYLGGIVLGWALFW